MKLGAKWCGNTENEELNSGQEDCRRCHRSVIGIAIASNQAFQERWLAIVVTWAVLSFAFFFSANSFLHFQDFLLALRPPGSLPSPSLPPSLVYYISFFCSPGTCAHLSLHFVSSVRTLRAMAPLLTLYSQHCAGSQGSGSLCHMKLNSSQ